MSIAYFRKFSNFALLIMNAMRNQLKHESQHGEAEKLR